MSNVSGRRPKLIATDLDGTIVNHDGTISERTISTFKRARDMGIEVFFVTGRPPRWMPEIRDAFGFGNAMALITSQSGGPRGVLHPHGCGSSPSAQCALAVPTPRTAAARRSSSARYRVRRGASRPQGAAGRHLTPPRGSERPRAAAAGSGAP
jgi:hypothetical protein